MEDDDVNAPADLAAELAAWPIARETWDALDDAQRQLYVDWLDSGSNRKRAQRVKDLRLLLNALPAATKYGRPASAEAMPGAAGAIAETIATWAYQSRR